MAWEIWGSTLDCCIQHNHLYLLQFIKGNDTCIHSLIVILVEWMMWYAEALSIFFKIAEVAKLLSFASQAYKHCFNVAILVMFRSVILPLLAWVLLNQLYVSKMCSLECMVNTCFTYYFIWPSSQYFLFVIYLNWVGCQNFYHHHTEGNFSSCLNESGFIENPWLLGPLTDLVLDIGWGEKSGEYVILLNAIICSSLAYSRKCLISS